MRQRLVFLVFLSILLVSCMASAQDEHEVDIYIFHGRGCPHCAQLLEFLEEIEPDYPGMGVHEYEVYFDQEGRELFEEMVAAYETEIHGVPMVFIGEKVIVGFSDALGEELEREISRCFEESCISPWDKLEAISPENNETVVSIGDKSPSEDPGTSETIKKLTIPAVISAAAVDAINPCAFAVLIILLTTILATGIRKRALYAGLAFTASIFISYLLMGIGLYSALQASGLTHTFYTIVAILAILVGLFNLKDYLWYGKWFIMEVPMSWRPKMKSVLRGITSVPGAFLIGFVISLFLLPCTSGPYIIILGMLAQVTTKNSALLLLLLYNFIFILPMLIITFAIYFGITTTEKAEAWRTRKLKILHLIAGIIILLLGIGMFIAMWLGLV